VAEPLDPELRKLIVCPACRGDLDDVDHGLRCPACRLVYPVEDGVPFLIKELARKEG
jgi:uncharacterized protein YbaR (Trm112 family)